MLVLLEPQCTIFCLFRRIAFMSFTGLDAPCFPGLTADCVQALTILVRIAEAMPKKSWVKITQCFAFLGDASKVAHILATLLKGSEVSQLLVTQSSYSQLSG